MISVFSKLHNNTRTFVQVKNAEKQYVIGFSRLEVAAKVYKRIHPSTINHIYLMKSKSEDITQDVNKELAKLGLEEFAVDELVVDVEAKLVIPKSSTSLNFKHFDYELSSLSRLEFMMFPFEKYQGIAITDDVERETKSLMILNCQLIDPCESYKLFSSQFDVEK